MPKHLRSLCSAAASRWPSRQVRSGRKSCRSATSTAAADAPVPAVSGRPDAAKRSRVHRVSSRRTAVKDIVWDKILSVGVDEIDDDHRKLIHIFNILNRAVADRESPEYLAAALAELIHCTVWHFSHEERLMLKHRYPAADEHRTEHGELILNAQELQRSMLQADEPFAQEQLLYLERWLTEHILTADARLGEYLCEKM